MTVASKQSNEVVYDENGGKTSVTDMIHNQKTQMTAAVSLSLHLQPREKTESRFDKRESRQLCSLFSHIQYYLVDSEVQIWVYLDQFKRVIR